MKTIQDLNKLIEEEVKAIELLDTKKRGGASHEEWAARQKEISKQRCKHKDEIAHLRRLILFVERTSEEGVQFMLDKLQREAEAVTNTARRKFDKENNVSGKSLIREYLANAGIPMMKKQIKELEFLMK